MSCGSDCLHFAYFDPSFSVPFIPISQLVPLASTNNFRSSITELMWFGDVTLVFLQLHLSTFFKPETLCSYTRSSPPLPSSSNYDQNSILHLMCTCNPRDPWMAREHKTYLTNINRLFPSNSILTSWLRLAISLPRSTSGVQNISIDQRRNLTLTFQNLKSKTCTLCQSHDHARRYGNLPSSVCHPI